MIILYRYLLNLLYVLIIISKKIFEYIVDLVVCSPTVEDNHLLYIIILFDYHKVFFFVKLSAMKYYTLTAATRISLLLLYTYGVIVSFCSLLNFVLYPQTNTRVVNRMELIDIIYFMNKSETQHSCLGCSNKFARLGCFWLT